MALGSEVEQALGSFPQLRWFTAPQPVREGHMPVDVCARIATRAMAPLTSLAAGAVPCLKQPPPVSRIRRVQRGEIEPAVAPGEQRRSEEHTSELQSRG